MLARYRQGDLDRRSYVLSLTSQLALNERLISVVRTDTARTLIALSALRVLSGGQSIGFTISGGVARNVYTMVLRFQTNQSNTFAGSIQAIVEGDPCAVNPDHPPPGPPVPPPDGGNVDGGEFDADNNTGQCPLP